MSELDQSPQAQALQHAIDSLNDTVADLHAELIELMGDLVLEMTSIAASLETLATHQTQTSPNPPRSYKRQHKHRNDPPE